jgi:hypothetical protein
MPAMGAGIYYMYMPLIKTIKETEIISFSPYIERID